jgi:hypothetical protein
MALNQDQLNQGPVGKSGKTLHELFSEYLRLKGQDMGLAHELEHFEMPHVDSLTSMQVSQHIASLRRLKELAQVCLGAQYTPQTHPWRGLCGPHVGPLSRDALIRSVRLAYIALSNFAMQVSGLTALQPLMESLNFEATQKTLLWLAVSWDFSALHAHSKVIAAVAAARKNEAMAREFSKFQESLRLQQQLKAKILSGLQVPEASVLIADVVGLVKKLGDACGIIKHFELGAVFPVDLPELGGKLQNAIKVVNLVHHFRSRLEGLGLCSQGKFSHLQDILTAIRVLARVRQMGPGVCSFLASQAWRIEKLGQPEAHEQILELAKAARPLLEKKQALEQIFYLSATTDQHLTSDHLANLAVLLNQPWWVRIFKKASRQAVKTVQSLVIGEHVLRQKKGQLVAALTQWALFHEQSQNFRMHPLGHALLGSHWLGIESDFDQALEAHRSLILLKEVFLPSGETYVVEQKVRQSLYAFFWNARCEQIDAAMTSELFQEGMRVMTGITLLENLKDHKNRALFSAHTDFDQAASVLLGLRDAVFQLGKLIHELRPLLQRPLGDLDGLWQTGTQWQQVVKDIEANEPMKQLLGPVFQGVETSEAVLKTIQEVLERIESAPIPGALKQVFLGLRGIGKLKEHQILAQNMRKGMEAVQDQMQKLASLTEGNFSQIWLLPINQLLKTMQQALKQPALLEGMVLYLQSEAQLKEGVLLEVLNFFRKRDLPIEKFEIAYGLVFNRSLLKKALDGKGDLADLDHLLLPPTSAREF